MSDRIKGVLFSMLASLGVEIDRVLDLYAGTGGIGIEALSRGASSAVFVDHSAAACAVIRANLAHTKFDSVSEVMNQPVATFLKRADRPFDFVIMDPPYADTDIVKTLEQVAGSRLIESGTIVAVGHWPRLELPDSVGGLVRLRNRCHGDSCVSIYENQSDAGEQKERDSAE